ncbi:MAG TPA: hypothetical protein DHN29_11120 [Cytophagales bacterium]|jgi:2-polyprenyl-3-methyl-5-hydroxy-6-metoxy-1,4-benzoquinol methylase|nr:hypothetical protein [Cytophagales bacterium]|tara:strand:+ start:3066 stop:3656 length:591 start_codon:yes stop_codon:yes gene_type:complete
MAHHYHKYERRGAIHWDWYYGGNANYKKLVDDALRPLIHRLSRASECSLVDVGSGDGLVDHLMLEKSHNKKLKILGIDPEETGNKYAYEFVDDHRFSVWEGPVETFVYENQEINFDFLFSLNTIEHVQDPNVFVELMKNVNQFGIIVTDDGRLGNNSHHHEQVFTPDDIKYLFSGFRVKKIPITHPAFIGFKISKV